MFPAVNSDVTGQFEEKLLQLFGDVLYVGDHSELGYAAMAVRALGTVHVEVKMTPTDYVTSLRQVTHYRDAPIREQADVAIHRLSEMARYTVKIILMARAPTRSSAPIRSTCWQRCQRCSGPWYAELAFERSVG